MPLIRRPPILWHGKTQRRIDVQHRHRELRRQYVAAVKSGCQLTYERWLHSPGRRALHQGRAVKPHRSGGGHATR